MAASATEVQMGPLKEKFKNKTVKKMCQGVNRTLLLRSYVGPDCLPSDNTTQRGPWRGS